MIKKYVAVLLLFTVIFSFSGCSDNKNAVGKNSNVPVYVKIEQGMTGESICQMLINKGIIDSQLKFKIYSKLKGAESKFQVGTYELYSGMDTSKVLDILISGKTTAVHFTIPEGYTVNEIAARLDEMGIVRADEFKKAAKDYAPYSYMTFVPGQKYRAEGFLFPDTYEAPPDVSAQQILQLMTENFNNRLTQEMRDIAAARGMSIYDLVILASLVEKEAGNDEERPIIAQVFHKRLEIFQPLESCATIQYLLEAPKEDLLIADTKIDSPYNTYQNYGLPLGPVANPGIKSIEAVLKPSDTNYLYFVADRQGNNHFTSNYEEHLAEVEKYR